MLKHYLLLLPGIALVLLLAMAARAQAVHPHSAEATTALMQLLSPLQVMQGEFTQVQSTLEGEELSRSSGVFAIQRPAQLRWETIDPFPQLLVSDGSTLWLYDPDLEQVTISALTDELQQTPAVIFSEDLAAIEASYYVTRAKTDLADNQQFILTPRQPHGQFQRLELTFEEGKLVTMLAVDGFAQATRFTFSAVKLNQPIDAQDFHFTPPPGTDVLQND